MSQLTEAIFFLGELNYVLRPLYEVSQTIFMTTSFRLSVLVNTLNVASVSRLTYKNLPAKLLAIKT